MTIRNWRVVAVLSSLSVAMIGGYQNCAQQNFSAIPNAASSLTGSGGGTGAGTGTGTGSTPAPGPTGGGTTVTIQQFQPALAVRDLSCLGCHANIQANVITDFGAGNSWFMNGLQNPTEFGSSHYDATTWQTLSAIKGQVFVPETTVAASYVTAQLQSGATAPTADVGLSDYLQMTDIMNFGGSWYSYFGEPTPTNFAFSNKVDPGSAGNSIVAQSKIFIGAPTSQEILSIVPTIAAAAPWVQQVGVTTSGLSGLVVVTGVNGTQYISTTSSQPITCSGRDVVINGTLLLNNTQIYAENGGCRLYVTGSVFIEGPITYLNSGAAADPTDNLQITSATSIIMGVGLNGQALNGDGTVDLAGETPLHIRLLGDVRGNMLLRGAITATAYQNNFAPSIESEGLNIGATLLQDASVPGTSPVALSAAKQSRVAINFEHVLLNAPLIHSRYLGTVNGVVVAESAMFSLGEFSFNYDAVFENPKVSVLPSLPYDIICTSSTACTPTSN